MAGLQDFERKLEQAISGVFARAFRSAVQPVEIAAALQRETDNNTQILSRDRRLVPNDFVVELSEPDLDRLAPYDSTLQKELTDQLRRHAREQGYVFPGPVTIVFEAADDLTTGRFRVRSRAQASVSGPDYTPSRVSRAYVDVNGSRHPLLPPSTVVGRGTDADLKINDPGISRRHVEFTVHTGPVSHDTYADLEEPEIHVRDLGSTNGMLVDGHRVTTARVHEGSVIKVGNTTLVVRLVDEDAPAGPGAAHV